MDDLRTEVARAIARRNYPSGTLRDIEDMAEGFILDADAAISTILAALREPTPEMVEAGVAQAFRTKLGGDYLWPDYMRDLWQAMLDARLAPKP